MSSAFLPRALFGGPLLGDRALRFIFADEAGISAPEKYTVVAALIVDADRQLAIAEALAAEVMGGIPAALKGNFKYSAKAVWGDMKVQAEWTIADRLRFLKGLMSVPIKCGTPLCIGVVPRTALSEEIGDIVERANIHHRNAFFGCMGRADAYIREFGHPLEVATLVAETSGKNEKINMRLAIKVQRDSPLWMKPEQTVRTTEEQSLGYVTTPLENRITRIRETVHFVDKGTEPLVDVADACAFGFRAFLNDDKFGSEYLDAMGVRLKDTQLWKRYGGFQCFSIAGR